MLIKPIKTRIFRENEDFVAFITSYIKHLSEESIVVITSKIVALSEGRTAEYISRENKIKLIKKESKKTIITPWCVIGLKDGEWCASAGIDESNAGGKLILLPKNSFKSAQKIRNILRKKFKIKKLGVILTDSRSLPLRSGVMGVAVGYAGIEPRHSYIGEADIFGKILNFTRTNVIDSLAASAVMLMGEADEQMPLTVITKSPAKFTNRTFTRHEMIIPPKDDFYRFVYLKTK